ncbi:prepilin-type N-terminal cleavage/methylation domain-containing protein [SCandidatus Aminicenantes bacterium Aminicenantia_JdfR_composite]|jgi:prepilin-type N-terminal cleavage/methylation domain-containing protein|nr:prepilin-type N-terminal cleavage/methylation domain-containing protein [SCandidatus Aminicenantes bacterium Aminicenantia_JdfR_composite]MCP2596283.1 prepilin-type N-terminal cleavage/methylation domain-containing protein [Candidatus Aminicenantes bacterium AC-335-G13]MCP2597858.1 prepilin-type N-terminal cleavage/methylation domain-containing protein [Candidatus Aminicenantes bacterium AC-335-L06]MCP2605603.1 prepilin-type N-terminal cleavage/methylation domain-containing protein [Candidatu
MKKGFTLIEILVILAIVGILIVLGYPSIKTSWEIRKLDDSAREILATLQRAKFQAVKTKTIHCVIFDSTQNTYTLSIYDYTNNRWTPIERKVLSSPVNFLIINLPDPDNLGAIDTVNQVIFDSLGFADRQGSITIQNPNLTNYTGVEDLRLIRIMIGGSIDIIKQES